MQKPRKKHSVLHDHRRSNLEFNLYNTSFSSTTDIIISIDYNHSEEKKPGRRYADYKMAIVVTHSLAKIYILSLSLRSETRRTYIQ